ncbi:MFS transporter [Staphylococcus gallinarum]|jgi:MHS family proline/betaine transporter-like MFS transporter|uniref:MFS transporter n=1 Tax=Staphylococcus gallinarum TaxID=1293 RepID=UPI000D1E2CD0|nr:MFS transporter [Staphylococcus gallinarum]MCD8819947.1 MFS transporter [Staphylococcus gallinarum]MCD8870127.1 MFS transporter [Staphylococcus gallinarum]MCQ9287441.1 MFS transporter [Staphylococcus gallinarum]MCW0985205.1 MFS transporter [Staphylococcus gallinarum]MEB6241625.1 MFS transporter [Staphylococcus gallinarum]
MKFNKHKINTVDINQAKKSVFATGIGNAMEWFDFALYSYLAVIISKNFFSQVENDEIKLIFTFATFAIAFLLRPVGGIVFGKIGDKYGRKVVLTSTIILMAISTFIIGVLPTYDQIGIWAPIILLIARIMQGFSVGGEYAGAMVYIAESSPDNKRIRLGSGLELGTLSGYIFASVLITIMFWLIPSESMQSWGWRIPFFVSIPIGLFGLYLRSHLEESPIFENDLANHQEDEPGFLQTIKENKRDILLCVVFVAFFNITNYMLLGYMPSYLDEIVGIKDTISTPITAVVLIIMLPFAIMFGRLGDKSGNKKIISVGLILGIVFSIISFQFLNGGNLGFLFIGLLMIGIVLSVYEGTMPGTLPTLFFTNVRYRTLSWTFNIAVSIFGGTTPLVASWLVHVTNNNLAPAFYLLAVSIIGLLVVLFLFKDTSKQSLKGSYPTVATEKEFEMAVENPKDSLWWKSEVK